MGRAGAILLEMEVAHPSVENVLHGPHLVRREFPRVPVVGESHRAPRDGDDVGVKAAGSDAGFRPARGCGVGVVEGEDRLSILWNHVKRGASQNQAQRG